MVRIRLFRTGTTKRPSYRIVAMDQRRQRQGRVLEVLGTYQPRLDNQVALKLEALDRWVSQGAQLTDTVCNIVARYRKAQAAASEGAAS
jgi:small subunit ribosomal protein S16